MDAIEVLMEEHRIIEKGLAALDGYASRLLAGAAEAPDLAGFVTFIREFADGLHHRKEEDMLFATMVEHGFPQDGGPIAVMLMEHDEGRRLVGLMAGVAALPAPWSPDDCQRAASAATQYTALLRSHIYKEDNVLYRMARMHLPEEAIERLDAMVEQFEGENEAQQERLLDMAARLIGKYGRLQTEPLPIASEAHACDCGGHATHGGRGK